MRLNGTNKMNTFITFTDDTAVRGAEKKMVYCDLTLFRAKQVRLREEDKLELTKHSSFLAHGLIFVILPTFISPHKT